MKVNRRAFLGSLAAVPFLRLGPWAEIPPTPAAQAGLFWSGWSRVPNRYEYVGYWFAHVGDTHGLINPIIISERAISAGHTLEDAKKASHDETLILIERSKTRRETRHANVSRESRQR